MQTLLRLVTGEGAGDCVGDTTGLLLICVLAWARERGTRHTHTRACPLHHSDSSAEGYLSQQTALAELCQSQSAPSHWPLSA